MIAASTDRAPTNATPATPIRRVGRNEPLAAKKPMDRPKVPIRRPPARTRPKAVEHLPEKPAEATVLIDNSASVLPAYLPPTRIQPGLAGVAAAIDLERALSQSVIPNASTPSEPEPAQHEQPSLELERVSPFGDDWTAGGVLRPVATTEEVVDAHTGISNPPVAGPRRRTWLPFSTGLAGVAVGLSLGALAWSSSEPPAPVLSAEVAVSPWAPRAVAPAIPPVTTPAPLAAIPAQPTPPVVEPAATPPLKPRLPTWTRQARALNPWVEVVGASDDVILGLPELMDDDTVNSALTGFAPEMLQHAPRYDFRIQTHEVTWQELGLYIATLSSNAPSPPAWALRDPKGLALLPATGVRWDFARNYCRALGGDLPSEPEWAWAARGPELRMQPWGDGLPDARQVRFRRGDPVPLAEVGTQLQDATPGDTPIRGLLGNASEWTRDEWIPSHPDAELSPKEHPADVLSAVRGWPLGDPGSPLPAEGLTYRRPLCSGGPCLEQLGDALDLVGFRCITDDVDQGRTAR